MIQFKQKNVKYSKVIHSYFYTDSEGYTEDDLITYLTKYFFTLNISFTSDLLYKAAYLTRLNGGFEYIAVKLEYGFELIYVGRLDVES